MTRIAQLDEAVALEDRYGDKSALARMASGPSNPEPPMPRTAAEIDPAPPDPGPCPTCGQPRANAVNQFATGSRAHPSLRTPVREAVADDDPAHVRTQERSHR